MTQQPRFAGIPGDECDCGRRASIRHCPSCGSSRLYSYARPEAFTDPYGVTKFVVGLMRCMSCPRKFTDAERQYCDAPPIGVVLAKLKVQRLAEARRSGEYLKPTDERAAKALEELMKADAGVESNTVTLEQREKARAMLIFRIKCEYADVLYELKCRNEPPKENVDEYVVRRVAEINATLPPSQQVIIHDRDKSTYEEEEPPMEERKIEQIFVQPVVSEEVESERYSLADRTFRLEWAQRKLSGNPSTLSPDEYVERRLKGELNIE